jgi:hypothetical protein
MALFCNFWIEPLLNMQNRAMIFYSFRKYKTLTQTPTMPGGHTASLVGRLASSLFSLVNFDSSNRPFHATCSFARKTRETVVAFAG